MTEELKRIIEEHRRRYPAMQTADVYKLAYQRELGGGHLITDEGAALDMLINECISLIPRTGPVYEDIGGGRVRIQLREALAAGISYETLFNIFLNSAKNIRGSREALSYELSGMPGMAGYIEAGCPAVHHSGEYRAEYAPAYRVADKTYADFFELFCRMDTLLAVKGCVVVAIDGMCGALKSTLSQLISGLYPARVLHTDDYFLPKHKRTKSRLMEPGGNLDYERFASEVTRHLTGEMKCRRYDCRAGRLERAVTVPAVPVTVAEGAYSLHPHFGEYYDIAVLLKVDEAEQERRILVRNGPDMLKRFQAEWIPMENAYLKTLEIEQKCDFTYKPVLY